MDLKKTISAIVMVLILLFLGFSFWVWDRINSLPPEAFTPSQSSKNTINNQPVIANAAIEQGLGGQIFEKAQNQNPLDNNVPQTNPFRAEINPFANIYKNPFK